MSCAVGVMSRLKFTLPLYILTNLYNTMILPYLTYCNIIWGSTASYLLQKIFLIQKRAIRIITNSTYLAHTEPLFRKLKILNTYDLHRYFVACFMFSYSKGTLPDILNNFFTLNSTVNMYLTRNINNFYLPTYKYNFSRTVVKYE